MPPTSLIWRHYYRCCYPVVQHLLFVTSSTLQIFPASVRRTQQVQMANDPKPNGSKPELLQQWHSQPMPIRIIHVGAGATGLCTAYKMERQLSNYELVCYEKNSGIGGTWFESESIQRCHYPCRSSLLITGNVLTLAKTSIRDVPAMCECVFASRSRAPNSLDGRLESDRHMFIRTPLSQIRSGAPTMP